MKRISVVAVACGLIALLVVAVVRDSGPTRYESEARFFVPYVVMLEEEPPPLRPLDEIRSEEFLKEVVEELGEAEILADLGTRGEVISGSEMIRSHLTLLPEGNGLVLARFQHPNPTVCKGVLQEILDTFYRRRFPQRPGQGDPTTRPSITIVEGPTEPTEVR